MGNVDKIISDICEITQNLKQKLKQKNITLVIIIKQKRKFFVHVVRWWIQGISKNYKNWKIK